MADKKHIIRTKILPYFGNLRISEISKEIITWQNELLAYWDEKKAYFETILKTLQNQLSDDI